jgi:aryl-alcohol dehydrogenase-like predicted oxidoreductase
MATPKVNPNMEYRRLGNTGLQVSILSLGSWVTFNTQLDNQLAAECIEAAGEAGCNFFDNAEAYDGGKAETIMGQAFRDLGWERWSYVLTTKIYWGINGEVPNMKNTLNRKYLMQAIDGSLSASNTTSSTCSTATVLTRTRRSKRLSLQ